MLISQEIKKNLPGSLGFLSFAYAGCTAREDRLSLTQTFQLTQVKLHAASFFLLPFGAHQRFLQIHFLCSKQTSSICFLCFSYPLFCHVISILFLYFFPSCFRFLRSKQAEQCLACTRHVNKGNRCFKVCTTMTTENNHSNPSTRRQGSTRKETGPGLTSPHRDY